MHRRPRLLLCLCLLAATAGNCCASEAAYRGIEDDRSNGVKHGLFEIREEARRFIASENISRGTHWQVLDPNLKLQVPRCAVALAVTWVPKTYGLSAPNVAVTCAGTIGGSWERHWNVFVPVTSER